MMGFALLLSIALLLVLVCAALAVASHLRHPPRKTYATAMGRGLPLSPEELGRSAEEVTLRFTDGHDSPGWIIKGDQPTRPTVIVIHGFGDSRYGALTWAHLLWPHASQLIVLDLPGHGESNAPTCRLGTREPHDILNLLDQIDTSRGVVLFGYSMGAGIAIAAASHQDPRLLGVIADGPYRYWQQPIANTLRARRWPVRPIMPLVGVAMRLLTPGWRPYDRLAQARQLTCPLLVLHGCCDEVCDPADAAAIAAAAPHGRLVEFDQGCHLDLARCDESRYRTALLTFFNSLPKRSANDQHG